MGKQKGDLEPGLLLPVNYVRTIDGDTIEVEIRTTFHVRLRDIDVVERKSKYGAEATALAHTTLKNANRVLVFIPANDPTKLMDVTSFERIVGDVYADGASLSQIMREHGYEKIDD